MAQKFENEIVSTFGAVYGSIDSETGNETGNVTCPELIDRISNRNRFNILPL